MRRQKILNSGTPVMFIETILSFTVFRIPNLWETKILVTTNSRYNSEFLTLLNHDRNLASPL